MENKILNIRILRYKRRFALFIINHFLKGTRKIFFPIKCGLLRFAGYKIGKDVKVVAPLNITGELQVGDGVWIGRNFSIDGNGTVIIGDCCDIAPNVQFYTGSHDIGVSEHRAGKGFNDTISIGNGCWCCAASKFLPGISVGEGSVVAAGAVVTKSFDDNLMIGGVPACIIKKLT